MDFDASPIATDNGFGDCGASVQPAEECVPISIVVADDLAVPSAVSALTPDTSGSSEDETEESSLSSESASEDVESAADVEKPISVSQLKLYIKGKYNIDLTHAEFKVDTDERNILYVPSKADYKASGLPDPMPSDELAALIAENEGVYIERMPANEDCLPDKAFVRAEKQDEDSADMAGFIVDDDVIEPLTAGKKRKRESGSGASESGDSSALPDGIDPANIIEVLPSRSCVEKTRKKMKYMVDYFTTGKVVVAPEDEALIGVCASTAEVCVDDDFEDDPEAGMDLEDSDGEEELADVPFDECLSDEDYIPQEGNDVMDEDMAETGNSSADQETSQGVDEDEEEEEEEEEETEAETETEDEDD